MTAPLAPTATDQSLKMEGRPGTGTVSRVDAKSTRFGLSLSHARTTSEERANVLLLLASLAHLFALLIGIAAEALHLERRYQANTVRTRRVLSLATLGRLVAATDDGRILRVAVSARVWTSLTTRLQLALPP